MSTLRLTTLSNQGGTASVPSDTVINGTAKAWVNFNGTGTVAIRAAFNVSSITDNGTGDYTVNYTNAIQDANYCVNISGGISSLGGTRPDIVSQTTTNTRIYTNGNGLEDMVRVSVSVFR